MHALARLARSALAPAARIVVLTASPLFAQTAGGERIVFVPDAVPAGFVGTIEVIALDGELFAQSSATTPPLPVPAPAARTLCPACPPILKYPQSSQEAPGLPVPK